MMSQMKNHRFVTGSHVGKTDFRELRGFNKQLWELANTFTETNRTTLKFGVPGRFLDT